jgi:hypothetical protein
VTIAEGNLRAIPSRSRREEDERRVKVFNSSVENRVEKESRAFESHRKRGR